MLYIDVYTNYNDIVLIFNDVLRAIHNFYVSTKILIMCHRVFLNCEDDT